MGCCKEFVQLGCVGSCKKEIVLKDAVLDGRNITDIKAHVLFPDHVKCVTPTTDGTNIIMPFDKLNEDYVHQIHLYYKDELLNCYKLKIIPEVCK